MRPFVLRGAAIVVAVAVATGALSMVLHVDARLAAVVGVALETGILAHLRGLALRERAGGALLSGVAALLVTTFVVSVLGPAYEAVREISATPALAATVALAFGARALADLVRHPASSGPSGSGGGA